ncbi:WbqC family protein [Larkinella insperata]|uniref:WbqC family protein n=1 Tax=Larkinella insperata TaxID=332158 RepID=A0ABW3QGX2_9BACT|nr:WbqC family protein [Larkinella insperata]
MLVQIEIHLFGPINMSSILEKYHVDRVNQGIRIELHYLPSLTYFTALLPFDTVWLEAAEHYGKQSYRNRCYVLTANGPDRLTVPVLNGTHKQLIRDVRIDDRQAWTDRHWRCLVTAYSKAPFFEFYADDLETVFRRKWVYLFELNLELLTLCLKWLGWKKNIALTEIFERQVVSQVLDARSQINARGDTQNGRFYRPVAYQQNFGNVFVPDLSILDLIFCQGTEASNVLQQSLIQ